MSQNMAVRVVQVADDKPYPPPTPMPALLCPDSVPAVLLKVVMLPLIALVLLQGDLGQPCHIWGVLSSKKGGRSAVPTSLGSVEHQRRESVFAKQPFTEEAARLPPAPSYFSACPELARSELFQMPVGRSACVRGSINTPRNDFVCLFAGREQELEEALPRLPWGLLTLEKSE